MSPASPQTSPSHAVTIRGIVRAAVERAWDRTVASGALPAMPAEADRPAVEVERPADPVHGDFASNLAMRLARPYRMAPLAIAGALAAELTTEAADDPASPIAAAEVAAPGFLNLRLRDDALEATVAAILADPSSWGRTAAEGTGRSVNVEFVSANPTGPLHVGNARGAFIGDLLSRVLEAGGQRVTREYYFNDSGGQIRNLGASVAALHRGDPVPEDGYKADYVQELATAVPDDVWSAATAPGRGYGRLARSLGGGSRPRRDRGQPGRARRAVRCLDQRGAAPRRGLGRRGPWSGCANAVTSTSRTARPGSARPTSATTRTGSSSARPASRPTSRRTSATSPRSSAAGSTS